MISTNWPRFAAALFVTALALMPMAPQAQEVTPFKQALAERAIADKDIAAFYKARAFEPVWTGSRDKARRRALFEALAAAPAHGLPAPRYGLEALTARLDTASRDPIALAQLEYDLSRTFLRYARDIQTGVLTPSRVDEEIKREVPLRPRLSYLENLVQSSPAGFFAALPPQSPEYTRLMKQKLEFERLAARGGWGPEVPGSKLEPGAAGEPVIALRNRLMAMGYLERTATTTYDESVQRAVQLFQQAHGLTPDGVAGPATLTEINRPVSHRLASVIVAMERERWMNMPRGARHITVNLADFRAAIIDNGRVTYDTVAVVGMNAEDRRSPEFSDLMEFMVINPSWYVPRSIATKEYLPLLKKNPNAVRHLEITDASGRKINRGAVNFVQYTEETFPFSMREPPSQGNALGLVKFMFPNRYNIYLHDTPAKSLFGREVRAFSHGCIRLQRPFEFAYTLLAPQTRDPHGFFKAKLDTGIETRVDLETPVPVHIMYRTAYTTARGQMQFRRDIYGRDGKIWSALSREGVVLRAVQG